MPACLVILTAFVPRLHHRLGCDCLYLCVLTLFVSVAQLRAAAEVIRVMFRVEFALVRLLALGV